MDQYENALKPYLFRVDSNGPKGQVNLAQG
jgi:hypothetical protein